MLDKYITIQKNAYNLINNVLKNGQLSHAYLIDENNFVDSFNFVISFVKEILCSYEDNEIEKQKICKSIDDGNCIELKVIEPDGLFIKKQQILELQQEYAKMAINGGKRIYIIRDCDKMRPETANSMLKFLEEPENNVLAILMTNNYNDLLSTIISRCQIIRLNNVYYDENNDELLDVSISFVKHIENCGIKAIIDMQSLLFDKVSVKDKNKLEHFLSVLIDVYYDILKIKHGIDNIKYDKYYDDLADISRLNSLDIFLKKIDYIAYAKECLKYNVNCSLLIDNLIVNIGGNVCL